MGNACFCGKCSYKADIQLGEALNENNKKPIVNCKINNISDLSKYFNENDKEINNKKNGKNNKKFSLINNRKLICFNTNGSKYELMLKRLLTQKEQERNGPKRRKTIRADISGQEQRNLILQVIKEQKDNNIKGKNIRKLKTGSILLNSNEKNKLNLKKTSIDFGNHLFNPSKVENLLLEMNNPKPNVVDSKRKGNSNDTTNIKIEAEK